VVTALYRRYRPETFAEMIGQSQVTEPLMTALRTNRVNHAYLFSGPRGCGKTTSARILARCLICVVGPTDTPFGKCSSCIELGRDGGGSLDVVEIDAASHGGVDDARDLRERAIFAPARDRYKIFILDEAHMVTASGFNALLKIVEEPPEHVKFIFATTEPEKVIGTIRSRTHHYPFRLVPPAQMLDYVQQMCDSEKITVAPGVLPLVVRAGGGSPRDTLSLLDQLMAGSEGNSIEYERAVALLGYTHSALLDEAIDAVAARDAAGAFSATDRVIQTGQDPRRFVEDLLERMRDLIIVAATSAEGAAAVLRGIPQDELDRMAVQASKFGTAELSRCADIVNAALTEMTGATSPRLHLELMIARMLVPSSDDTERGALARVERLERRVGVSDAVGSDAPAHQVAVGGSPLHETDRAQRDSSSTSERPLETAAGGLLTAALETTPAAPSPAAAPSGAAPIGPVTTQQVRDAWPQILDAVQKAKRSAWLVVYTAHVRGLNDDVLSLSFPSDNDVASFKQQTGGVQGVSEYLRQAILAVLGIRVKFIARSDAAPPPELQPKPAAGAPVEHPTASPAAAQQRPQQQPAAQSPAAPDAGAEPQRPVAPHSQDGASARTSERASAAPTAPQSVVPTVTTSWPTVAIPGSGPGAPESGAGPAPASGAAPVPAAPQASAAVPASGAAPVPAAPQASGAAPVPADDEPPFEPPYDDVPPPPDDADGWYDGPPNSDDAFGRSASSASASSSGAPAPKTGDPRQNRPISPVHGGVGADSPVSGAAATPATEPAAPVEPARQATAQTSAEARQQPSAEARQQASAEPRQQASVAFQEPQRYGESVVRELLGATFIEEQPASRGEAR
jgi:DNA polymerase-3 subunit gamma/tau